MTSHLPPGFTKPALDAAMRDFGAIVGPGNVLATDEERRWPRRGGNGLRPSRHLSAALREGMLPPASSRPARYFHG